MSPYKGYEESGTNPPLKEIVYKKKKETEF